MTDDLRPVGSGLERMLRDMGMPQVFDVVHLVDEWQEVAGEPFASLAEPVAYGAGELVLRVADGSAASLLKFQVGDLVERLAARYGAGNVTTVRLRVGRAAGDGKKGP